jgi:hypothetical protein
MIQKIFQLLSHDFDADLKELLLVKLDAFFFKKSLFFLKNLLIKF